MAVDLDVAAMAKLAREMAMGIRNYRDIFKDFDITEEEYYEVSKNEFFKKLKEQFSTEWNSANSTEERLRLGSLAYLEQMLPAATRQALKSDTPLASATDWSKVLMKMAGVGEVKGEKDHQAERFVIQINMGADTETYNKSIEVNPDDIPPPKKIASNT
jgi:hypothetical protein